MLPAASFRKLPGKFASGVCSIRLLAIVVILAAEGHAVLLLVGYGAVGAPPPQSHCILAMWGRLIGWLDGWFSFVPFLGLSSAS